jgi:hypothetical protein
MSFVKGLIGGFGISTAVAAVVFAAPGYAQATKEQPQMLAQAKTKAPVPAPTPATERGPSNVDLVNKALNPGASDPDVPLPHPDLANSGGGQSGASSRTQIFGRQEQGGGVLGLRMAIPADRGATGGATRFSSP